MQRKRIRYSIIVILALLSVSIASECDGFLDDTTCVKLCTPPKVNDVASGKCIPTRQDCQGAYFQPENICLLSCPPRTVPGMTLEQKKVCIPLDIPMMYPKAANLNCTKSQYWDFMNSTCASNTTACSGRVIPEIAACVPACPNQFIPKQILDPKNNTVNACLVNPYQLPVVCGVNQVRNATSNTCLDSAAKCVGFLIKEKALCVPNCPPESGPPQSVANATYSLCTERSFSCNQTQIIDQAHSTCLDDASSCVGYLIPEKRLCVEECPDFNLVKSVNGTNYKICVPCLFKDVNGTCFQQCPPTMRQDNEKRICLDDVELSCNKYYVKLDSSCVDQCPFGTIANNDSQPKTCVPCSQSPQGCPDQQNLCRQKLSADKTICGEDCPNFQYPVTESGKPYQQCKQCDSKDKYVNLAGTDCVDKCDMNQAGDRATRRCISIDNCSNFLFKDNGIQQCGKACPLNQAAASGPIGNSTYTICSQCDTGKFLDASTQKCVVSCSIFDAKQTYCLKSISDCIGFISSNNSTCGTACATGQVFAKGIIPGQFICSDACPSNTFLWEGKCFDKCQKGTYPDTTTKKCVETAKCQDIVSLDGQNCVKACDAGQFVQTDEKSKVKVCKICQGKISSDGQRCDKDCSSGDVFDADSKKCLSSSEASSACSGKIYSADKKNCSNSCPKGQLLQVDAATQKKQCLSSISACSNYVSSDMSQCVSACQDKEAIVTQNSVKFCRVCAFGATTDKSACQSPSRCDSTTQVFDRDLGKCVDASACSSKLLSVDGLKCGAKCEYPEVNRPLVSTTQCYTQCGTNEIRVKDKGCVASTECTGYISAGNGNCVEECIHVREAIDSTSSVPKTCKQCKSNEIPAVVTSNGKKVISCQTKSDGDAAVEASGMSDILGTFSKIAPEQKSDVKQQISSVADTLEATMKSLKSNLELSDDEKKSQLKTYLTNVKEMAKSFSSKVEQSASSSAAASAPESQIILGSSEFQLITESLKAGNVFNVNFSLDNFLSAAPKALQVDPASVAADKLVSSTTLDIATLQAVNLAKNPYCADATKCSSFGLFSVDYTLASGKTRRQLSAQDGKTFQTVYKVSAANIKKSVCVSYDETTGQMSPAVSTSTNTNDLTITCTFYLNSDLYLDNSCQYIDASLCAVQQTTTTTIDQPTSGATNLFSLVLLAVSFIMIDL